VHITTNDQNLVNTCKLVSALHIAALRPVIHRNTFPAELTPTVRVNAGPREILGQSRRSRCAARDCPKCTVRVKVTRR
jgi:hypothetical protein